MKTKEEAMLARFVLWNEQEIRLLEANTFAEFKKHVKITEFVLLQESNRTIIFNDEELPITDINFIASELESKITIYVKVKRPQ